MFETLSGNWQARINDPETQPWWSVEFNDQCVAVVSAKFSPDVQRFCAHLLASSPLFLELVCELVAVMRQNDLALAPGGAAIPLMEIREKSERAIARLLEIANEPVPGTEGPRG